MSLDSVLNQILSSTATATTYWTAVYQCSGTWNEQVLSGGIPTPGMVEHTVSLGQSGFTVFGVEVGLVEDNVYAVTIGIRASSQSKLNQAKSKLDSVLSPYFYIFLGSALSHVEQRNGTPVTVPTPINNNPPIHNMPPVSTNPGQCISNPYWSGAGNETDYYDTQFFNDVTGQPCYNPISQNTIPGNVAMSAASGKWYDKLSTSLGLPIAALGIIGLGLVIMLRK